jgi:hypothetical protein
VFLGASRWPPQIVIRYADEPLNRMTDLAAEIERAMDTRPAAIGDSCFVCNSGLEALRQRGAELLPAIEFAVRSFHFDEAKWFADGNLHHILLIYFERAADLEHDVSGFVRSLAGRHLKTALLAIFQIWGPTRGQSRRRTIAAPLYQAWHDLNAAGLQFAGKEDWLAKYVADGSLAVTAVRTSA